jgi:hypothetical protein
LPPQRGNTNAAFTDASGGSVDSFTLCVAHAEGDRAVIDCLRERRPPFNPSSVVDEFRDVLRSYHVDRVGGDRYSAQWVQSAFRDRGITYDVSDKHLNTAGVRVFAYLTDAEIRLDSPIDALIVQVQAFGAAIERQKAGQRTYDALVRKAKSGHVTGGQCFGYDNVPVNGHVERRINEKEAAVVRRIFELCAAGHGQIAIAHRLKRRAGHCSPRATGATRGVGIEHGP